MNDYLFEPGKTLRFEFSFGDQVYTARVSPGLIKSNGTKFFHARWWIKEIENSSLSVGADFTPRKSEKSDYVTWTVFPSGVITKSEFVVVPWIEKTMLPVQFAFSVYTPV